MGSEIAIISWNHQGANLEAYTKSFDFSKDKPLSVPVVVPDAFNGGESNKHVRKHSDITFGICCNNISAIDEESAPAKMSGSSHSSSSSSSDDDQTSLHGVSSKRHSKSDAIDNSLPYPASTAQISAGDKSPTQSPAIQGIDLPDGYDPCRIPSSVFQRRKSTVPLEWSATSNDSLFSINCGTCSFSRDLLIHDDSVNSRERKKSGELIVSTQPTQNQEKDNSDNVIAKSTEMMESSDTAAKVEIEEVKRTLPRILTKKSSDTTTDGSECSHSFSYLISPKKEDIPNVAKVEAETQEIEEKAPSSTASNSTPKGWLPSCFSWCKWIQCCNCLTK